MKKRSMAVVAVTLVLAMVFSIFACVPVSALHAADAPRTFELYDYFDEAEASRVAGTAIQSSSPWSFEAKKPGGTWQEWLDKGDHGSGYTYWFNSVNYWGVYPGVAYHYPVDRSSRFWLNFISPVNMSSQDFKYDVAYAFTAPIAGSYTFDKCNQDKVISWDAANYFSQYDSSEQLDFGVRITLNGVPIWNGDSNTEKRDEFAVFGSKSAQAQRIEVPTISGIQMSSGDVLRVEFTVFTPGSVSYAMRINGTPSVTLTEIDLTGDSDNAPKTYEVYDYYDDAEVSRVAGTEIQSDSPWSFEAKNPGGTWQEWLDKGNHGSGYTYWFNSMNYWGVYPGVAYHYPVDRSGRFWLNFISPVNMSSQDFKYDVAYAFTAPTTGSYTLGKCNQDKVISWDASNYFSQYDSSEQLDFGVRITLNGATVWNGDSNTEKRDGFAVFGTKSAQAQRIEVPTISGIQMSSGDVLRVEFTVFTPGSVSYAMRINGTPAVTFDAVASSVGSAGAYKVMQVNYNTSENLVQSWGSVGNGYRMVQSPGCTGTTANVFRVDNTSASGSAGMANTLSNPECGTYTFSACSKAENVKREIGTEYYSYGLTAIVFYSDGTSKEYYAPFTYGTHDWEHRDISFTINKPATYLTLYVFLRAPATGTAYFDDVKVMRQGAGTNLGTFDEMPVTVLQKAPAQSTEKTLATKDGLELGLGATQVTSLKIDGKELKNDAFSGFMVRDIAADPEKDGVYSFATKRGSAADKFLGSQPTLGLDLKADFKADHRGIRVSGVITEQKDSEDGRAVQLSYALPITATGWKMGTTTLDSETIETGNAWNVYKPYNDASVTVVDWDSAPHSYYPTACVYNEELGIAIAASMEYPSFWTLEYNGSTGQYAITYQLGVVKEAPESARFDFVIYKLDDPSWGFRSAMEKYTELYPEQYEIKQKEFGTWAAWADLTNVPDIEDFNIRFRETGEEGRTAYDFEQAKGIKNVYYFELGDWWISNMASSDDDAVWAKIRELAKGSDDFVAREAIATEFCKNLDPFGKIVWNPVDNYWCEFGAQVHINANPRLPGEYNFTTALYNDAKREELFGALAKGGAFDGIYLDEMSGWWLGNANFNKAHYPYTSVPLTYSPFYKKPMLHRASTTWEAAKHISDDVHSLGKMMFSNKNPERYAWNTLLVDAMGTEQALMNGTTYTPPTLRQFAGWRTLAYQRSYSILTNDNYDLITAEIFEDYFNRCLAYAVFPSPGDNVDGSVDRAQGYYWIHPDKVYERDRDTFKKYMPTLKTIAEAGWEPVTYATANNENIVLERYGENDLEGCHFTVYNPTAQAVDVTVNIDLTKLKLADTCTITKTFTGGTEPIETGVVTLHLEPERTEVITIQNPRKAEEFEIYGFYEDVKTALENGTEIVSDSPWRVETKEQGKDWVSAGSKIGRDGSYIFVMNEKKYWGAYPGYSFYYPEDYYSGRLYLGSIAPTNAKDAKWKIDSAYTFEAPYDGFYNLRPADQDMVYSWADTNYFKQQSSDEQHDFGVRITKNGETIWNGDSTAEKKDGFAVFGTADARVEQIAVPTLSDLYLKEGDIIRVEFTCFTQIVQHAWTMRIRGLVGMSYTGDLVEKEATKATWEEMNLAPNGENTFTLGAGESVYNANFNGKNRTVSVTFLEADVNQPVEVVLGEFYVRLAGEKSYIYAWSQGTGTYRYITLPEPKNGRYDVTVTQQARAVYGTDELRGVRVTVTVNGYTITENYDDTYMANRLRIQNRGNIPVKVSGGVKEGKITEVSWRELQLGETPNKSSRLVSGDDNAFVGNNVRLENKKLTMSVHEVKNGQPLRLQIVNFVLTINGANSTFYYWYDSQNHTRTVTFPAPNNGQYDIIFSQAFLYHETTDQVVGVRIGAVVNGVGYYEDYPVTWIATGFKLSNLGTSDVYVSPFVGDVETPIVSWKESFGDSSDYKPVITIEGKTNWGTDVFEGHKNGVSFTILDIPSSQHLTEVAFSGGYLRIAGANSYLYRYINGQNDYRRFELPAPQNDRYDITIWQETLYEKGTKNMVGTRFNAIINGVTIRESYYNVYSAWSGLSVYNYGSTPIKLVGGLKTGAVQSLDFKDTALNTDPAKTTQLAAGEKFENTNLNTANKTVSFSVLEAEKEQPVELNFAGYTLCVAGESSYLYRRHLGKDIFEEIKFPDPDNGRYDISLSQQEVYAEDSNQVVAVRFTANVNGVTFSKELGVLECSKGLTIQNYGENPILVTRDATETKEVFYGVSVNLSSQIDANFYLTETDPAKLGTMTLKVGGKTISAKREYNEQIGRYYYACPVTALELAEDLTATYTVGGKTYTMTTSVKRYIELLAANTNGNYPEKAIMLAKKIANYGHYAQTYLASIHNDVTIGANGYAAMTKYADADVNVAAAKKALTSKATVKNEDGNTTLYGFSLSLKSKTGLNVYVDVQDGSGIKFASCSGKKLEISHVSGNRYKITVPDIEAALFDQSYTVTVNGVEITVSVLDYCALALAQTGTDAATANAVTALYEYYVAANNFAQAN